MTESYTVDIPALLQPVQTALGQGLSAFSGIESHLALIFSRCMMASHQDLPLVAFDAINLTSPKLRVLRATARRFFDYEALHPDEWYDRLNKLLKRVEARTEARTKLAHWTVSIWHPNGMPIAQVDEKLEARMVPPWFSAKNLSFNPDETMTLADISAFTAKCHEISNQLFQFSLDMAKISRPPA